jgi:excisionase family DNA binding protein
MNETIIPKHALARPPLTPGFHTIQQAAIYCAVSEKTVRRWIARRQLAAHKLGALWRIADSDLKRFLRHRWQG